MGRWEIGVMAIFLWVNKMIVWISQNPQLATVYILAATCFVGILYTLFTACLFNETKKQRELQISPILVVRIEKDKNEKDDIFIINTGEGTALDIKFIFPLRIYMDMPNNKVTVYTHKFKPISCLPSKEKLPLAGISYCKKEKMELDIFKSWVIPGHNPPKWIFNEEKIRFIIEYQNGLGLHYITNFCFGSGGISKIKISRKSIPVMAKCYIIEFATHLKILLVNNIKCQKNRLIGKKNKNP
jgi:hypothetical protein